MRRRSFLTATILGASLLGTLAGGLTLVATRAGDGGSPAAAAPTPTPRVGPVEHGLPTTRATTIKPTGRGRGVSRAIPCYLVTSEALATVLGSPMGLGQRAGGSSGSGLHGNERESCYWFSTKPDGPYVVISDITTGQLRDRGRSGWSARRYFEEVPPPSRTYLSGIGDAAYAYGPASVGVLVGDVYVDVTVVSNDSHPLTDAVTIARVVARLRLTGP